MIQDNTLQETKFRDHKLGTNDLIIKLQDNGFKSDGEKLRGCGTYLKFSKQEHQQTLEQRNKLKDANFCKFRFCEMCNWRRTKKIGYQLIEALESIEASKKVSYIFLTLTIKNPSVSDLKATVKHINQSFQRMAETVGYKNAVIGHFKALEILGDNTPDEEVHPHFHILLIVSKSYFTSKNYISQDKWIDMWQKALRVDYRPVVDIRKIKPNVKKRQSAIKSAVYEVAKYAVKHTELTKRTNEDFTQIINQTRGMRFFSTGGYLKEKISLMKLDDDLIGLKEQTEALWKEIEELIYKWQNGNYFLKTI